MLLGYGNLVPATFEGRIFCICYGLFGVPLILITVADLGKFLSEHIIWLYGRYSDVKRKFRERLKRRFSRKESVKIEVIGAEGEVTEEVDDDKLGIYDYVSIPVTLVLLILVGYTALGIKSKKIYNFDE